jgi:ubiquinone/menaquinone biosynthesis C-methylase UbiE
MATDNRDLVKQRFGAHAEQYVSSVHHATGESLDRLLELAAPQPGWRALDIATGGGHMALALAPRVAEVVATDLTPEMLAAAERFIRGKGVSNVSFQLADAMALPFADGEFDLVTCRIAPHHFPDCAQFVRETARVLRPGGVAAVIDNVVPPDIAAARHLNALEKLRDPSHNWAYTAADWLGFFVAAGLAVTSGEIFTKTRDFDYWIDMQGVDAHRRAQVRLLIEQAPAAARAALAPQVVGGALKFQLTEVLVVAHKPLSNLE